MRYNATGHRFYNNKCLAIGGGSNTAGSGVYLSEYGGGKNFIYDNEIKAILNSDPTTVKYANAITFEQQGEESNYAQDQIYNNIFGSNNYIVRIAGWDGGCYQKSIHNNTLEWINGNDTYNWFIAALNDTKYKFQYPQSNQYVTSSLLDQLKSQIQTEVQNLIGGQPDNRQHSTFYSGYWTYDSYITLIDSKLQPGVSMEPSDVYLETSSGSDNVIIIGHSIYIKALGPSNNEITNTEIEVHDNKGVSYKTRTNANGIAVLELINYELNNSESEGTISKYTRTSHSASIDGRGSVTLPIDITNNENNPYILSFGGNPISAPSTPSGLLITK